MELGIGPHLDETELEQYSMGTLPDAGLAPFEEHLLACETCQDRLLEMEAYVKAVRSVSPKLRKAKRSLSRGLFTWPRLAWVAAVILSVVALTMVRARMPSPSEPAEIAAVFLHSSRGIDGLPVARSPAGKSVSLNMDLTELPAFSSYRVELVNSMGKLVLQSSAVPRQGRISQPLTKGLPAGQYYVRLYAPAGDLLREFALRVE